MVKLIAKSAADGLLPMEIGGVRVEELSVPMASLAPYDGQGAPLAQALEAKHGVALPQVGRVSVAGDVTCQWFGLDHVMLIGVASDVDLSRFAAVVDQSDAWCRVQMTGARSRDVLARLTSVDLREAAFPVGATVRTDVQHMSGAVTRAGDDGWEVMVFRSMAGTLVHDLKTAMETVAGIAEMRSA